LLVVLVWASSCMDGTALISLIAIEVSMSAALFVLYLR
jgi:hypothetical protein